MKKRSSNHIWPAYVDMMTVLLLVYVLVSLLFAMMIKENLEAQYKQKMDNLISMSADQLADKRSKLAVNDAGTVLNKDTITEASSAEVKTALGSMESKETPTNIARNTIASKENASENADVENMREAVSPGTTKESAAEEVIANDNLDMLVVQPGDLMLTLNDNQELLSKENNEALNKWYQENRVRIKKNGIDIGIIVKKNTSVSLGAVYRKQYMLYMDILRALVDKDKEFEPSNYSHRSPKPQADIEKEFILLKVKKPVE
ncbi:MAG: hypothetical protein XXXJIFNMEKO3_02315 [Candidatus Erwinia impunctatus]|nr:hypothetical protein XXXJIFNMEKO_02315 [Culicoides impunctatus]